MRVRPVVAAGHDLRQPWTKGAAATTPSTSRRMACASSSVSDEAAPAPRRAPPCVTLPGVTMARLAPSERIWRVDEVARARADRHHGDDGSDADDDAEHGQQAAQSIGRDGGKRGADRFDQSHSAASAIKARIDGDLACILDHACRP